MARLPRLYAPAVVQHIVQRPVSGRQLFVDAEDYRLFVGLLEAAVRAHAVALHAYVLLPGQIRMLATPTQSDSIARLLQTIGRRYVPHLNRKAARSGPLWDRRYRSTLIDAAEFLLTSMRYIEQQPVAAGHAVDPGAWRWSSYAHHIGREQQALISDHARYWGLSDTPFERQAAYRAIVDTPMSEGASEQIESAVEKGWVLGGPAFVTALEGSVNRRAEPLRRGRKRSQTTLGP